MKDALVANRVSTVIDLRAGRGIVGIRAVEFGIVAARAIDVIARDTLVHFANFWVGVDVSREADTRGRCLLQVGNEPVGANDAAGPEK